MRIITWSSDVCSSDLTELKQICNCDADSHGREVYNRVRNAVTKEGKIMTTHTGGELWKVLDHKVTSDDYKSSDRKEERRVGTSVAVRVDIGGRRNKKKKRSRRKVEKKESK